MTHLLKWGIAMLAALILGAAAFWYSFFTLHPYELTEQQKAEAYEYAQPSELQMQLQPLTDTAWEFTYRSFDDALVNGQIHYPRPPAELNGPVPLLIGLHAMGRSQIRWWQDSFKDNPTVTQSHRISRMALDSGYAVIAIDAREHGKRKNPDRLLPDIMWDMHLWGDKENYEQMIHNTVRDHRVLLDWLEQQPALDASQFHVAGYSMGGQGALLLAALDARINRVLSIVPPHTDSKLALVSPLTWLDGLSDNEVLLVTANDDEHASESDNLALFNALPTKRKRHISLDGGHILPPDYVEKLKDWF
ncbi:alpha/beta hydrolase family protein [Bowmanella dokdonensis]|uniref:Alpha/beta fold hydrolase n=1 Tax=Bowmanella dokdonensis TaxID=751969 RepID=A0A939DK51_9ALTE|nr:alpha/beta fold hydrolase [Bowmanella dokdonensis]MBN7824224.1 alpha/beta fold hydrolase [Bowmanella dokdonensis]